VVDTADSSRTKAFPGQVTEDGGTINIDLFDSLRRIKNLWSLKPLSRLDKDFHKENSMADFVSISGIASDGSNNKFNLTVMLDGSSAWQAGEPGGTSNIFNTKNGVWMRAVDIVTLFQNDATTRVAQLTPLVPETAKPNDQGQGHNFETAVDFTWVVLA
jgi:hypothetical protein